MTDELCKTDAYEREAQAIVTEVRPDGIVLDRTVFYVRGGGQPGDTGAIEWSGGRLGVADTVRSGGTLVHVVDDPAAAPSRGTAVRCTLDWNRRYLLMRTHTALHVLSGLVWTRYGAKVTGGNMEPGEARMDFELEAITADFGREVEAALNEALASDRTVRVLFMPRAEALSDPDLVRTKVNLIPESVDPIRIIDIEGIDRQADGGTHVASTGEVGGVRVVKTENKGKGFKRMRIALAGDPHR